MKLIMQFPLSSPVTSSLLGPNTVLSIMFTNITETLHTLLKTISIFDINLIPKIKITFKIHLCFNIENHNSIVFHKNILKRMKHRSVTKFSGVPSHEENPGAAHGI
jgi:hypothetical protein